MDPLWHTSTLSVGLYVDLNKYYTYLHKIVHIETGHNSVLANTVSQMEDTPST